MSARVCGKQLMALFFALIGLIFGGARGLLLGGIFGFLLGRGLRFLLKQGLSRIQSQFIESTFAVVGAICKADGVVTKDEIQFAEGLFERFHLAGVHRDRAKAAFRRGKEPEFDLESEVDRFARTARGNHALFQMFLRVQLMAVIADGQVHPAEKDMLVRVARRLGLSEREVALLLSTLSMAQSAAAGAAGGWAQGTSSSRPPPRATIDDAYSTLGVSVDATDQDIKRAYHKLIRENHPDRLAAKGLPENMRELAEERTREINAAYDVIKRSRGTS